MCYITVSELEANLDKYMLLSHEEDVYVMENKKILTVLVSPQQKSLEQFLSLRGVLGKAKGKEHYKEDLMQEICEREGAH